MKANLKQLQKHRIFSEEFKRSIVKDFETGKFSVQQLGELHNIKRTVIYRWIYKFSTFNEKGARIVEMKDSSSKKLKELEKKVKVLEQKVGQKQIKIDFLEKMMEIAEEEYNIDISKKSVTSQSAGSGKTKKRLSYSLNALYRVIGISKQAVDQYAKRQHAFDDKTRKLVVEADTLRAEHPGCGVEKMYYTLKPDFMGRDRFNDLFMDLGYRLKRMKNYRKTTIASKLYYPNLIKGMKVNAPSKIWQSDITYIRVKDKFYYAVFIIDVFTRKIVGHQVSDHMRATANMSALNKALRYHPAPQYHHSDSGSQYTCTEYTNKLSELGSSISMGLIAQDNAYAERINGTIKNEYLDHWKPQTFSQLKYMVDKAVNNYNTKRIHNNRDRKTPINCEKLFVNGQLNDTFNTTIYQE